MTDHTSLGSDNDFVADAGTARNSALTDEHAVFAELHVVRYLYQVIDLRASAYPRDAKGGSIDCRVCADLAIGLNMHDADLRYFVPDTIGIRRIAKTITAYDRTSLKDTSLIHDAPVEKLGARV